MPSLTPQIMLAFQDELEKQGINLMQMGRSARGLLARQGTAVGSGVALGGLAGGGLGAVGGGGAGYLKARQGGATRGEAARSALGGALEGAKGGAQIGALAGGAGGLAGGAKARGLVSKLRGKGGATGAISRFGERQVHGLTGYVPHDAAGKMVGGSHTKALRSMKGGAHDAVNRMKGLEKTFKETPSGPAREAAAKKLMSAQKHVEYAKKTEDMGITSLPGYLKALGGKGKYVGGAKAGKDIKKLDALKAGVGEQWHGTGGGAGGAAMKGLIFGLPAAGAVAEAVRPSEAGEEGRFARTGRALGGLAYGMGPLPLAGMHALSKGMEGGGALVGKGLQKATGIDANQEIDPNKVRHTRGVSGGRRL